MTIEREYYTYISDSGTPLEALSGGAVGQGYLLYYPLPGAHDRPSLVVRLRKEPGASKATAEVYAAPGNLTYVPVTISGEGAARSVSMDERRPPTLSIESLDGYWVRRGKVSYNLNIQINEGMYGTWGVRYEPDSRTFIGWPELLTPGEPAVKIQVRDPKSEGRPLWELRTLIPAFSNRGFYRTTYAERKCQTPVENWNYGVTPDWPYVIFSDAGSFEQRGNNPSPPIVLNWLNGKVTHFTELVPVRYQNCAYSHYSILPITSEGVTQLDFETPYAVYDLSKRGTGTPNLIVLASRHPDSDPWFTSFGRLLPENVGVRYSWRNRVGDLNWDYKLGLLGLHAYTFKTPVAGGSVLIDSPPYRLLPKWVIDRKWPLATFIDAEGASYQSSEGIYEWDGRSVNPSVLMGWQDADPEAIFSSLPQRFRGEYRLGEETMPRLYYSPIDNRLHLLNAQGGQWTVDETWGVRVRNLLPDPYLDSWERYRLEANEGEASPAGPEVRAATAEEVAPLESARLLRLGDYLLLSQAGKLTIRKNSFENARFTVSPPTDAKTWRAFRNRMRPLDSTRRDPGNLRSWFTAFSGPTLEVSGAHLSDLSATPRGVRFALTLTGETSSRGKLPLPALLGLTPGRYVVSYERATGAWSSKSATPPQLRTEFRAEALQALLPTQLNLVVRNAGSMHLDTFAVLRIAGREVERWDRAFIPGDGAWQQVVAWTPERTGTWRATLELGEQRFFLGTLGVSATPRITGVDALRLSVGDQMGSLWPLFAAVGFIVVSSLWLVWGTLREGQ